jgi:hypothetical protein
MTVSSSTSRVKYSCNGSVTEFAFTFGVGATSEIQVIYTDTTGTETVLTETTHYAVSATNNDFESGGKVTTVATYATGTYITILRNVPLTQASDFTENRATLYETFEDGLDKNIRIDQQQQEEINRIPKLAKSSAYAGNTYTFPDPSASKVIGWNSGATDLTTYLINGTALNISNIVNIGDYSNNIATAISSIGSAETTLCINASTSGNATIPTNVQLWFVKGGQLTGTVTFAGSPDAQIKALPGQQIFGSTTTITFAKPGRAYVSWFGDNTSVSPIQKAVNSLPSAGGEIIFTTAQHTIDIDANSCGVKIDKSNIKFTSTCRTEFIHSGSDIDGLWFAVGVDSETGNFTKVHDITFDGLVFTGSATATSSHQAAIYGLPASTNYDPETDGSNTITISNCKIFGFTSSVYFKGASNVEIYNCDMGYNVYIPGAGAGGYGVLVETIQGVRIHHNRFLSSTEDRHAVYISADMNQIGSKVNRDVIIDHNIIRWHNTVATVGTAIRQAISTRSTNRLIIDANEIYGSMRFGISFDCSNGNAEDYTIVNNIIQDLRNDTTSAGAGIGFLTDATYSFNGAILKGNKISEASDANYTYGIQLADVPNTIIEGNIIDLYGANSIGILLSNESDAVLMPNIINLHGTARSGIAFTDVCDNITIHKQKIEDFTSAEIESISSPTLTDIHYTYPLRALITADGIGGITVTEGGEWIDSCVSDAVGGLITLKDFATLGTGDSALIVITSSLGDPDNFYYRHSTPSTITFLVGIKTLAGVPKPLASQANIFEIFLMPH